MSSLSSRFQVRAPKGLVEGAFHSPIETRVPPQDALVVVSGEAGASEHFLHGFEIGEKIFLTWLQHGPGHLLSHLLAHPLELGLGINRRRQRRIKTGAALIDGLFCRSLILCLRRCAVPKPTLPLPPMPTVAFCARNNRGGRQQISQQKGHKKARPRRPSPRLHRRFLQGGAVPSGSEERK